MSALSPRISAHNLESQHTASPPMAVWLWAEPLASLYPPHGTVLSIT